MDESDDSAWLVIQRNNDSSTPMMFARQWTDFAAGFPSQHQNSFWIGNDVLFQMTTGKLFNLRVDMVDYTGRQATEIYTNFLVSCSANKYTLSVGSGTGSAGDALNQGGSLAQNGAYFSTTDKDNDESQSNCAGMEHSGWWYSACGGANVNGAYSYPHTVSTGIRWNTFSSTPLKEATMMIQQM